MYNKFIFNSFLKENIVNSFMNSPDPFAKFLRQLGRIFVINFLFLVCSIPVVTTGAALTAAHKVMMDMANDSESHVVRTFFDAFKENFKVSTLVWLIVLAAAAVIFIDFALVNSFFASTKFMNVFLTIMAVAIGGIFVYVFPLIARYENKVSEYLRNAAVFAVFKFHRTIAMVAIHSIPILLFLFAPELFFYSLSAWLTIGIAFMFYIDAILLKPPFEEIEKEKGL